MVLSVALIIFAVIKDQIMQFRVLGIIIVCIGCFSSFFYICELREAKLVIEAKQLNKEFRNNQKEAYEQERESRRSAISKEIKTWADWLKEG